MRNPGEPRPSRFIPALQFRALTPIFDLVIRLTMREGLLRQLHVESMQLAPGESVLDPDPDVLRIGIAKAHRAGVELDFEQGSADSLPFEDARFDLVVSSLTFHHLPASVKPAALSEAFRVLRPGGRLSIADFGPPRTRIGLAATLPIRLLGGRSTTDDNFYGRLPSLIESAGFSGVFERSRLQTVFGPVCFYTAARPRDDRDGAPHA